MVGFWNLGLEMIPNDRPGRRSVPRGISAKQKPFFQTNNKKTKNKKNNKKKKNIYIYIYMKMVDEDGWILELRAENDTK